MGAPKQIFDISLLRHVRAWMGRDLGEIVAEELSRQRRQDLESMRSIRACIGPLTDGKMEVLTQFSLFISLKGAGASCPPSSGVIQAEDHSRRGTKILGPVGRHA